MKQEIIGFLINNIIYTGRDAVSMVKITKGYDQVITKDMAKFMAACDLGYNWEQLAKAPIILVMEDGEIRMPTIKENEYKYYVWEKNGIAKGERFKHLEC